MASEQGLDITQVTPEEFAGLVAQASDEQIVDVVHGVGTKEVLDRVFQGMGERFVPEKAEGVDAVVQFVITDGGEEFPYTIAISNGSCEVGEGPAENPKVTITTDVVSFAKMIAGQAEGTQLFMTGKLRASGDLMFATRMMTFFDRPKAQT
jgi:putative sterol carrier protein